MDAKNFIETNDGCGWGKSSWWSGAYLDNMTDEMSDIEKEEILQTESKKQHIFHGGVSMCGMWIRPATSDLLKEPIENIEICQECVESIETMK